MNLRDKLREAFWTAPREYKEGRLFTGTEEQTPEYEQWRNETFGTVKITPTVDHPDIDAASRIRRFMDLPKFLDLMANRRLLLPRIADLQKGDPFECAAKPDYSGTHRDELEKSIIRLRELTPKSESQDDPLSFLGFGRVQSPPPTFEERIKSMTDKELGEAAWYVEHSRLKYELKCSCWYGSEMESDAMWRLYCDSFGVCISTTVSRLKASISCYVPKLFANDVKLSLARVVYKDTDCCGTTPSWLIKRSAFRHEHEIRLFIDYPYTSPPGFELIVDPNQLIEKITVTPYSQKWQADVIEATVEKLLPSRRKLRVGEMSKFQRSAHLDASDPAWPKKANYFDPEK
jgi:hypothetical protein